DAVVQHGGAVGCGAQGTVRVPEVGEADRQPRAGAHSAQVNAATRAPRRQRTHLTHVSAMTRTSSHFACAVPCTDRSAGRAGRPRAIVRRTTTTSRGAPGKSGGHAPLACGALCSPTVPGMEWSHGEPAGSRGSV